MLLIPAIDLKDGKCVRLRQGDLDDATGTGPLGLVVRAALVRVRLDEVIRAVDVARHVRQRVDRQMG